MNQRPVWVPARYVERATIVLFVFSTLVWIALASIPFSWDEWIGSSGPNPYVREVHILDEALASPFSWLPPVCLVLMFSLAFAGTRRDRFSFPWFLVWGMMALIVYFSYLGYPPPYDRDIIPVFVFFLGAFLGLFFGSSPRIACPRLEVRAFSFFFLVVIFPVFGMLHFEQNFFSWYIVAEVDVPEREATYCIGSQSDKSTGCVLIRRPNSPWYCESFDALCSERAGAIIRPGTHIDEVNGQFHFSGDGRFVGASSSELYYYFLIACEVEDATYIERDNLLALSPFVLIGASDELHEADVKQVELTLGSSLEDDEDRAKVLARRGGIAKDLDHPNPKVRECAATFLAIIDGASDEAFLDGLSAENSSER